jgi:hypothetical protein
MKQEFTWHAFENAQTPSRSTRLINIVTEYFAYVGVIGVAVCIAVMTLAFSAAVGIQVLDKVAKPGFFETQMQQSAPATKAPEVQPFKPARFAMTSTSNRVKGDVVSSDY